MAKHSRKNYQPRIKKQPKTVNWPQLLLAMTLIPLILGILLIILWAVEVSFFEPEDTQMLIGVFIIILSFTLSNTLQKRWFTAVGWLLLGVANLVLLGPAPVFLKFAAIAAGAIGMGLLGTELLARMQIARKARHK